MKKLLLVALAAVGMAACVQNEELVAPKGDAIKFNNAFVENATKVAQDGSYTATNGKLESFNVWGTMTKGQTIVNIFEGVEVSNATGAWEYDAQYTQYWINDYTYNFAGVVDAESVELNNGLPSVINVVMSNQKDVLYAVAEPRAYNGTNSEAVSLSFKHILAKAKFTVKNTMTVESGFDYQITDIRIKDVENAAAYDIVNGWFTTSKYDVSFGSATLDNVNAANLKAGDEAESNYVRYLVPEANKTLNIEVDYVLNLNGTEIESKTEAVTAALDVVAGHQYNFIITFGNPGDKVTFEPTVEGWLEDADLPIYEGGVALVSSPAALQEAIESDEVATVVLSGDINLNDLLAGTFSRAESADPSLKIKAGKELTLDLNGKKLSATSTQTGKNYDMFDVRGTLTIKNGTIEYEHLGDNMGWGASTNIFNVTAGGVLNLEGVTAKNLGGSDMAFVAHLNNWGECTLNVEDSTLESTYIAVRVFNSGYDMNNVTIENSTLKGKFCFWVHNYKAAGDAVGTDETLNVVFTEVTFDHTGKAPILYGFANPIYKTADGYVAATTADELASLVSNAKSDIEISVTKDLEGIVTLKQNRGVHVTIHGNGKQYKGGLHIFGNGGMNDRWMTIKNINFDGTGLNGDQGCIYTTGPANGVNSYACNVTIEDCTFTGAGIAAIRQNVGGERNWTVKRCTVAEGMHSFLQVSNTNESLVVENCVVKSKNGANLNYTANASFTGCNFDVQGYAVRVGVNGSNSTETKTFNFTDCTLKSANDDGDAVVIIRQDAQQATLNFVNTELIGDPMISGNTANTKITGIALPQQNNEIWYVSDEMALEPTNPDAINATVVSNVWDKTTGKGILTFDAPITVIGEKAFHRVTNATPSNWATSITLPEGVETIGNYAFAQCYSLTSIVIPNSVTAIGQYAFQSCDAVTKVTLGSRVADIGSGAFYNCYEIKEIVCKSTEAPVLADKWVFNGVDKSAKVVVPATSVDAYKAAAVWSAFTNIVAE